MNVTINAKSFISALKQATAFIYPDVEELSVVYVWTIDCSCVVFAMDGCNAFMHKIGLPNGASSVICTALSKDEVSSICRSVPKGKKDLFDFLLPDHNGTFGVERYNMLQEQRTEPMAHMVPPEGYPIPSESWLKALTALKNMPVHLQVYKIRKPLFIYIFSAIDAPEIWVMPMQDVLKKAAA